MSLMDVLDEVEGKAIIWAHWQADIKNIREEISKESMVRVPWLIIMGSRLKTKDRRIVMLFRMILKYDLSLEHPKRVDMELRFNCSEYGDLLF